MESDRISTSEDWPTPQSVRNIQVLYYFTNSYRRLIRKSTKGRAAISNMPNTQSSRKWEWSWDAKLAFRKPKKVFSQAPILPHFNQPKPIIPQTDASGFAIAGILNYIDRFRTLREDNFYSRECAAVKQNYDTYDWVLLAFVKTVRQWGHYLEGANHKVLIQCYYKNLEYFQISKVHSRRQARWAEILSSFDFGIERLEGKKNPPHGASGRPDNKIGYERPTARLMATFAATTFGAYNDLV